MKPTKAQKNAAAKPVPTAPGTPNAMSPNEQQIRLMAVLQEKDGQIQAALTRTCQLNADLAVARAKIKELEERLNTKAPTPAENQAEAGALN